MWYDGHMIEIAMAEVPAANAETYASGDPALWAQFKIVLEAIELGLPRSRETALRWPGGKTAWVVDVVVHGRDDLYQVIWAPHPSEDGVAYVAHLGPALS